MTGLKKYSSVVVGGTGVVVVDGVVVVVVVVVGVVVVVVLVVGVVVVVVDVVEVVVVEVVVVVVVVVVNSRTSKYICWYFEPNSLPTRQVYWPASALVTVWTNRISGFSSSLSKN